MWPRNSTSESRLGSAEAPTLSMLDLDGLAATLFIDEHGVSTRVSINALPTLAGRNLMTILRNRIWNCDRDGLMTVGVDISKLRNINF